MADLQLSYDKHFSQLDKATLERLYVSEGLGCKRIANMFECSPTTISKLLRKYGIQARPRRGLAGDRSGAWKGGKVKVQCNVCGKPLMRHPSVILKKVFCTDCKAMRVNLIGKTFGALSVIKRGPWLERCPGTFAWKWICECSCGKIIEVFQNQLVTGNRTTCGNASIHRSGENAYNFKPKIPVKCAYCGKDLSLYPSILKDRKRVFCRHSDCYGKWKSQNIRGDKCHNWIGGSGFVGFDSAKKRLDVIEPIRRNPENESVLQVKCTYCDRWFTPSRGEVSSRIRVIEGQKGSAGECRFYCSDACKIACPTYRKREWASGYRKATSREVDPELRKMVFERDDWKCQICHSEDSLHCHHIEGYARNKMLANDIENCITLCKTHHKWVHSKEGCRYFDLRCDEMKGYDP